MRDNCETRNFFFIQSRNICTIYISYTGPQHKLFCKRRRSGADFVSSIVFYCRKSKVKAEELRGGFLSENKLWAMFTDTN